MNAVAQVIEKLRALPQVVDPHCTLREWRRMAHKHAQQYRKWGMSAADWEDRVEQLEYNHVLPKRELNAIMNFVWRL